MFFVMIGLGIIFLLKCLNNNVFLKRIVENKDKNLLIGN